MSIPMIQRREIEAKILKEVYEVLTERYGKDEAQKVIARAVRNGSIAQAKEFAAREPNGTSLDSFVDLYKYWTAEDALVIEQIARDDKQFDFNVIRCRYAEMYKSIGLGEIGHLLSCQRDGTFCEGYDPRIRLTRTQTIMQGASHCDFRYRYEPEGPDAANPAEGANA